MSATELAPGAGELPQEASAIGARAPLVLAADQNDRRPAHGTAPARQPGRFVPFLLVPAIDGLALATSAVVTGLGWFGALYAPIVLLALAADGQHRARLCLRVSDQVPRLAAAAAWPLILLLPWWPVEGAVAAALLTAGMLVTFRGGGYLALRAAHRHGRLQEQALILGSGPLALEIAHLLGEHPELGVRPRGFLDHRPPGRDPLPSLGRLEELDAVVAGYGISRIIVCSPAASESELTSLLRACRPLPADVCVVPRLHELGMALPRGCLDEVWGVPLVPLRHHAHTRAGTRVRRAFDLVVAALLSVVGVPLLAVLTAAVRISSGRGVFFRQERVTRGGRTMSVVKLRTVVRDAQQGWVVPQQQCTRLGGRLRALHFDELPQLLNVVRGDMSLVGPRPERPYFALRFAREIPRYSDRHRTPGGMTGWAQVHGLHGDTSIRQRARFDNQYIEYWSLWLDAVIVARTLATVLVGSGWSRCLSRGGPR
ncbi:exopolysaccharide biosynthesis polyprenyl glycosylphosphotransferase [Halopolyspora algeriensis]|uniref:Exopolysaccharide biosynthesis polyprenyl glycosylphosphotransferase n=1 Tax=Halopolyspora algeriensis TaxID=1500506 RepID=A0A368VXW4_9ACTN|nr:sugar transferase [Halopolyspora algeriensis]RCW44424.1 exopolysaccharide biosynthesis polyprenyl glycosylphosphotransferase [Halopolyspora algeriensis]TQM55785.1 exopolysaccharide biosynthesis polyprenyl glycosylphosphotransferase [Halopolyspora algeriensis]